MASEDTTSVIRRKLARAGDAAPAGGRAALPALRLALARSASALMDLPLAVIGAAQGRAAGEALAPLVPDACLMILLDGAEGTRGAALLDGALVEALIQQQTMGSVAPRPGPERAFTDTDAAMAAPLLDAVCEAAAALAQTPADRHCLQGYRFGARSDTVRSLLLALEAPRYRSFDLSLDIAAGLRKGRLILLLPDRPAPAADPPAGAGRKALGAAMQQVPAELRVVLNRLRLPLAEFAALRPGDLLPLMPRRLDRVELVAINGETVSLCHLGQSGGVRAVRVNERFPVLPETAPEGPPALPPAELFAPHEAAGPTAPPEPDPPARVLPEEEPDLDLAALSPEEAVREISQLAGLSLEGSGNDEPSPVGS